MINKIKEIITDTIPFALLFGGVGCVITFFALLIIGSILLIVAGVVAIFRYV